jgi:fucose permease
MFTLFRRLPETAQPVRDAVETDRLIPSTPSPDGCGDSPDSYRDVLPPEHQPGTAAFTFMASGAMFSFVALGLFASIIGVVLPEIQVYYSLSDIQVSLIFLAGPGGYVIAAQLNHLVHLKLGRRGIAFIGPLFQFSSAVLMAYHPNFPALLVGFSLAAFGGGLLDGSWCAWAGATKRANLISGLLHGSFSIGAGLGPLIANSIMADRTRPWFYVYYMLVRHLKKILNNHRFVCLLLDVS